MLPLRKWHFVTFVFTAHPPYLPVTTQPCKYDPGPHQRSHLRRQRRSQRGRKALLDFTKEVNRWTQRREEIWETDEQQCFSVMPLTACKPHSVLMNTLYLPDQMSSVRWSKVSLCLLRYTMIECVWSPLGLNISVRSQSLEMLVVSYGLFSGLN